MVSASRRNAAMHEPMIVLHLPLQNSIYRYCFYDRPWHLLTFSHFSLQKMLPSTESKPSCRLFNLFLCIPSFSLVHSQQVPSKAYPPVRSISPSALITWSKRSSWLKKKKYLILPNQGLYLASWNKQNARLQLYFTAAESKQRGDQVPLGSISQKYQTTLHAVWGYLEWLHPGQREKTKQSKKKKSYCKWVFQKGSKGNI